MISDNLPGGSCAPPRYGEAREGRASALSSDLSPALDALGGVFEVLSNRIAILSARLDALEEDNEHPPSSKFGRAEAIIKTVANFYRVSATDIRAKGRQGEIVWARHAAMYFCYKYTDYPARLIGRLLFRRDKATVFFGVKSVKNRIESDPNARAEIECLELQCAQYEQAFQGSDS